MVPHLVTALTGPLLDLEKKILEATPAIERWFRLEWQEHTPPFYCSVDLRNAGFKLAPVDSNLFPRGFNHLAQEMLPLAVQAAMAAIDKYCPDARNVILIPEKDLDDPSYSQNVSRLVKIFRQTGLHVRLGCWRCNAPRQIALDDGSSLTLEPLQRSANGRRVVLPNFDPCTIILNNDLAQGVPAVLDQVHEQNLLPPLHAGWSVRRKHNHFAAYDEVAKKFGKLIDIDPWMVNPLYGKTGEINLALPEGADLLKTTVDGVLSKIRKKYKEYGIKEKPFVIVKGNASTEGAGIFTLRDAKELTGLLERAGNTLGKDGEPLSDVVVQEGVYTFERINEAVTEPVVYMIDRYVIGGYYRVHEQRAADESLNMPGSRFVPLAFAQQHAIPDVDARPGASAPNRFYMYGVVARLALLAASLEMERTDPDPEVY
ncbi:glutamate--cysteine ligase [Massilia sp. W12]|uniref:glutamate--cysteine ligase n=1 Tax=Massilia sp. W12 TaxID=3126507 RepID=UPI0030D2E656